MTQALAVNDIIKAQLWSHDAEQAAVNTFHYQVTAVGGVAATLEDFCDLWSGAVFLAYKALLNQIATFDGVLGQIIFPLPLFTSVKNTGDAGVGTGGATAGPRQTAGLISWKTALAGPGGRGRTYVPFPSNSDVDTDGTPNATYVGKLGDLDNALGAFTTVSAGGRSATVAIGIRQSKTGNFVPFNAGVNNKKWATQKRRGSYGRPNSSPF